MMVHYGFGGGRGAGRGFGLGYGRGGGYGRGLGLGYGRGGGRGRGGLPRWWHFMDGVADCGPWYGAPFYWPGMAAPGYAPYGAGIGWDDTVYLREQADAIKSDLDAIETRIRDLEAGSTANPGN